MTYTEALSTLTKLVLSYPQIRQTGSQEEVQLLRDEISEALYHFGDTYAYIRSAAERAESNLKNCLNENRKRIKSELGDKKGTVAAVDLEANLSCKELQDELLDRNEDHYLARSLLDRSEQILNAISSRLKLNSRHE